MEKFEKVIEEKKIKSATRIPKYGMRKLSVGLVSCALGISILGIADPVQAQEAGLTDTEQVQETEIKDTSQDIETTDEIVEVSRGEKDQVEDKVQAVEAKSTQVEDETQVQSVQEEADVVQAERVEANTEATETLKANSNQEAKQVEENLEISEEKVVEKQKAGEAGTQTEGDKNLQKADDPNYSEDEKEIQDYSGSERYKETDLTPGSTIVENVNTDEGVVKDGFKFDTLNPSPTSPSKTEYGYEIVIDKETGQRTYTKIFVTDSMRAPVDTGDKPMMGEGEKLTPDSPGVTYKPDEDGQILGRNKQRQYNYEASEETLKHINSKDNSSTVIGMKDNYTEDNPAIKLFKGGSFLISYKVNPWPNENDKLEELKLNKNKYDPRSKYFVQGQEIDTGIKVDNVDDNAKERLVGQVYNPITGKIVPGASAYIGENGNIHVKLPEGALKKDENGKTIVNEDSIFNTKDYKGIQNLDVKFFARPRTAEEFTKIAETPDDYGETGTYVGTGAGTGVVNHKGTNVTIDKQGIDRYDHYNLIGDFKLNLDDTRYYDQKFVDKEGNDTENDTSIGVKPGEPFTVKMDKPEGSGDSYKTADEMNEAEGRGEAAGKLIMDFINRENKGKAEADQWKLKTDPKDIASFTITAPESAKAGDFIAIPVEYTYTNGSKDTKWFHFVVQESDYIKPEYDAQVNFPVNEQTSPAKVADNTKRIKPDRYSLPDTLETDEEGNKLVTDDKGNKWTVKVDEKTGQVSAKPVNPKDFNGGEKLEVPVISHYVDEKKPGEDITKNAKAYFVIEERANMTPRYNAKAGKAGDELSSDVILNTEDTYNRRPGKYTLESNTYTDDKGNTWNVTIDEKTGKVTATVPEGLSNDKLDGALLNVPVVAHYYEENGTLEVGTRKTEVQFVATGADLNSPEYNVSIGDGNSEMKSSVVINADDKKDSPTSYTIDETKTYTDDKGNEWTVSVDGKTGEVKATPKDPSKLKGGEKLQVPVTAHYGEGDDAPTHKTTAEFVVKDKEYASPDYKSKVVKVGESQSSDVKLTDGDNLKKPTKYTLGSDTFVDDKGNTWTVTIDETTGKVTAKAPQAAEGKVPNLDGALLDVPVTAHYEDATGKEVTRKTSVQFMGTGTQGTHKITEEIPFEIEVKKDPTLKKGEWAYAKDEAGNELRGEKGEKETTLTIVDSKVTETSKPTVTKKPKNAVILIGEEDYTGTVTHTEKIETPFEVEYQYSDELESGETKVIQKGEKGSYDLVYSQNIKNGQADGDTKTSKENIKEAKKEIIVIGIKPVEKVVEKGFNTEYIYDDTLEAGKIEEKTPGKNGKTTIKHYYDKDKKEIVTEEKTENPTNRVVRVGIKPIEEETELPFETEYVYDENMEAGKTEVTQEGEKGKAKITTSFNKETGKLETKVERKEPTKKIVKYGSKTEGSFKVESEIPFNVKVIEDDTLDAGTHVVDQEGVVGKKETIVKVKNSKEESREENVVKEAIDKIIRVGTKPTENMCPVPEDPDKPGQEDPDKPGQEDPGKPGQEDPGKPGQEDPGKPGQEDPGKPGQEDPSKPGQEDPGKPGQEDPGKPGQEDPGKPGQENPGKPGQEDPGKPGQEDPGKPGQEDPGKPGQENSGKTDPKNPVDSKIVETEKEKDSQTKEEVSIEEKTSQKVKKDSVKKVSITDDSRAPQTFDPGLAPYLGLGGMTSTVLAYLEYRKRKNKKNK